MYWADELAAAAEGPQVVNDSKTPSGTVHVGSLRGVVLHDAIRRALLRPGHAGHVPLRRRRPGPDGRPGAPDPRRGRAVHGRAARPRPRAGRQQRPQLRPPLRGPLPRHVRGPGHPAGALLDERAVRGRRHGPLHQPRARPRRRHPRHLPHGQHGRPSRPLAAHQRHLRELRPQRHDHRQRMGRPRGDLRVPRGPRRLGHGLRLPRADLAVRRPRQAGVERRLGRPVGPGRCHHRGLRQGPRHRGWLARPRRRHQPARLRARAADQRAVRVPDHRGQEDEHEQGLRGRRPRDRRAPAARTAALPVPAPQAAQAPRVRPGGRHDPRPVRRVRPHRRGCRRPRGARRAAARSGAHLPHEPRRCRGRPGGRGRPVPAGLPPPRAAGPGARAWTWRPSSRRRRARPSTTPSRPSRRSGWPWPARGWRSAPPTATRSRCRRSCRPRCASSATTSGSTLARWRWPPSRIARPPATRGRT